VNIASKGISALGKLAFVGLLLAAFIFGMAGVVYMSLSGKELTVPEIVGKDYAESEKELAALGLKIKRRADRASTEKINTVLEQLPKAGETGQMILVVVSKAGLEGEEVPSSLKKNVESDDAEKIEEMITDKPKKAKSNSNTNKKKVDTTRDVIANTAGSNTSSSDGKPADAGVTDGDKSDKNDGAAPATKPAKAPAPVKP
jgi:beta-lactam-binding protein with PASTA domain